MCVPRGSADPRPRRVPHALQALSLHRDRRACAPRVPLDRINLQRLVFRAPQAKSVLRVLLRVPIAMQASTLQGPPLALIVLRATSRL